MFETKIAIDILGLGPSIKEYKSSGDVTIGVNDIYKYVKTDYLLVMDPPNRFEKDRIATILFSTPKKFFTNRPEWNGLVKNIERFNVAAGRGNLSQLDNNAILCHSSNSTFTAVCLAHKMGAKEIVMWGVDMIDHKVLSRPDVFKNIVKHFRNLHIELSKRGVSLYVGSRISKLSSVIPVYPSSL